MSGTNPYTAQAICAERDRKALRALLEACRDMLRDMRVMRIADACDP